MPGWCQGAGGGSDAGGALFRAAARAWARARRSVAWALTLAAEDWEPGSSTSTVPSALTLRRRTARPGGTWTFPMFTPLRTTGKRTETRSRTCRGQSSCCWAISAMSNIAGGMTLAAGVGCVEGGAADSGFVGRGPARAASEGVGVGEADREAGIGVATGVAAMESGAGEGEAAGVGSSVLTSAMAAEFAGVGLGVVSSAAMCKNGAGSEILVVAGSAVGEGRATAIFPLDSQWDSGSWRDQIQSPALSPAQKNASQEVGLWKNARIPFISRPVCLNRKRNSFCSPLSIRDSIAGYGLRFLFRLHRRARPRG